jgi:hypothetical protein
MRQKWLTKEIELLRKNYGKSPTRDITKIIKRTKSAIRHKASKLGLRSNLWVAPYRPNLKPSSSLSYVIGVILGDGNLYASKQANYGVNLPSIIDLDFAEEYSRQVSTILGRNQPYSIGNTKGWHGRHSYRVQASSKILYEFLKNKELNSLKPLLESYPAEFIRGFFDSEGGAYFRKQHKHGILVQVGVTNNNLSILRYIQQLLHERFSIISSISKDGKSYKLRICQQKAIVEYAQHIGFSIRRKSVKLQETIDLIQLKGGPHLKGWNGIA